MVFSGWYTVQFFLYEWGVCEVQKRNNGRLEFRCSCECFASEHSCNHVDWVWDIVREKGDFYIEIAQSDFDQLGRWLRTPEDLTVEVFREIVMRYASPRVIDLRRRSKKRARP